VYKWKAFLSRSKKSQSLGGPDEEEGGKAGPKEEVGVDRCGPVGGGGLAGMDLYGSVLRREQTLESIFASEDRKPGRNGLGQARVHLRFVVFAL